MTKKSKDDKKTKNKNKKKFNKLEAEQNLKQFSKLVQDSVKQVKDQTGVDFKELIQKSVEQYNETQDKRLNDKKFEMKLSPEEKAQRLVEEAWDLPVNQGMELINEALELDPDNVDAIIYSSKAEIKTKEIEKILKKAISVAKKKIDPDLFEEISKNDKFYLHIETRPYMRAVQALADFYFYSHQNKKAELKYKQLLKLNSNDNNGARFIYSTLLLRMNKLKDFRSLYQQYKDDITVYLKFNYVLYLLKLKGKSLKAKKALKKAHKSNKHVIPLILDLIEPPDTIVDYYRPGDIHEAELYFDSASPEWYKNPKFMSFMEKVYNSSLKNS
ncbi:MAG: tetratricopeptide repeat protein [Myxococcota bacterium]